MEAGFSHIFPWEEVGRLNTQKLKKSPIEVVPQKNIRNRIILDLSFPVYPRRTKKGVDPIQASVKETTERLSLDAPIKEIGDVFHRLLQFINSVCTKQIVMLPKIVLSDRLCRMLVEEYG